MMRLRLWSALISFAVLVVSISCTGPAGPPGPPGPPGSPGGSSGPPYVWVCMPAHRPNTAGFQRHDVYVFNGSGVTANVAINILDSTGNNLAGALIPGSAPATNYPGDLGATTVPVTAGHTRNINWPMPTTGGPGFDGVTNVAFLVRITSDQPVVASANFAAGGFLDAQCSLLPK